MSTIIVKLNDILEELDISKNRLAVESKMRPNLIFELTDNKTKAIKFDTLARLLDTINYFSKQQNKKRYEISDIIQYVSDDPDDPYYKPIKPAFDVKIDDLF